MGGIHGLVVTGRDASSGHIGFKSQHRILDGPFSQIIVVKIVMLEKTKIKRPGIDHIFLKKTTIAHSNEIMHHITSMSPHNSVSSRKA